MPRFALAPAVMLVAACQSAFFAIPRTVETAPAGTVAIGAGKPSLTVVVAPGTPERARVQSALDHALGKSFDLRFAEVPSAPRAPEEAALVELDLAFARKAYVAADFGPCISRMGDDARVTELLADSKRLLAERLLFWRIACRVGAGKTADARADADTLAVFDLEVPPDVASAAPEVESLIAAAVQRAADQPRVRLAMSAEAEANGSFRVAPRAVILLDGRRGVCTAPCSVDVHTGDHVVRIEADGFAPEVRRVRAVAGGVEVAVRLAAAGSDLAAAQWTEHYAGSASVDSAASVGLLSVATRSRSLALVAAEPTPKGTRLLGVLALDGGVAARSERTAGADKDLPDEAPTLVRDLLMRGQLLPSDPPLYKKPLFWVAVGVAAAAAAAITILLVYEPAKKVELSL